MISLDQLQTIMPNLPAERAQTFLPWLNAAMDEGEINTPLRMAAFLGQIAAESGELRFWLEQANGMHYDITVNPHLAGILGNDQPGDGPKYKGRGPIQLTGKSNYTVCGNAISVDLVNNPDSAASHEVGFRVAVWYWGTKNLNTLADVPDYDTITFKINGGYNGKPLRDKYYAIAKQALGC
jgi:predicted chitinase